MKLASRLIGLTAGIAMAFTLASCGGGGGGSDGGIGGSGAQMGTLSIAITDAPSCGYDEVNITIEKIRVNQSSSAGETEGGWSEIVLSPPRRIDLLTLTNGVLEELGQVSLPAGRYSQLRLVLASNSGASPPANSVIPTGRAETALTTPSAQQSGLKLNVNMEVPAGQVADYVLDFDACKSVVKRGNSGQYNLKPVIAVIPRLSDAGNRVIGFVDPAMASGTTNVSVQQNGIPVKATVPQLSTGPTLGQFVLYPVPAGSYDLVVTSQGRVTAVMTGVPVVTTAPTFVNSASVPISPPAAASAPVVVNGTVTPATATVRALQGLTGGPTIEFVWLPVDALNGAFAAALPPGAPVKTAYVANPSALNFVADAAAAGKYTFEAQSGPAVLTQFVDVNAAVPPVTFTFP
jgi:hypothetical protein